MINNRKVMYIVYLTINKLNGMMYVGVHKTFDIDKDCYYGSGRYLLSSIDKYGKWNFEREVLFIYYSKKVAYKREKYIVNDEFIKREDTLNLKLGGIGGWDHCHTVEARNRFIEKHGSLTGHMNNDICRSKIIQTKILNDTLIPRHLHTPEMMIKKINTRSINGTLTPKQCLTQEAILKSANSRKLRNKRLRDSKTEIIRSYKAEKSYSHVDRPKDFIKGISGKYDKVYLINPLGKVEYEGNLREVSSYRYGDRSGESMYGITLKLDKCIPYSQGKWKGYTYVSRKENIIISAYDKWIENQALLTYPGLSEKYTLYSSDSKVVKEGTLYEVSSLIYGSSKAVSKHTIILNKINLPNAFIRGKWKGCYFKKN